MKRFRTGVVIGKFCPPHRGHHHLIDTALAHCDHVSVLVCWKETQSVPIHIRTAALQETHPDATIIPVPDTLAADDTPGWAACTIQTLGAPPDAVFTSEDYGEPYARAMNAVHIMVDRHREKIPCSATLVRSDPLAMLKWLSPYMRAYYVKRICLVGAESTGKTTLAEALSTHYQTAWVPEYGREYCEEKWKAGYTDQWTPAEFVAIAREQARREDAAARTANRILICDTDPFATSLWHERYLGTRNPEVEAIAEARTYALYLLTGDEIPFVQDGLRDGEHIRHAMHARFVERLNATNRPWALVTGSPEARLAEAIRLIDASIARTR